jgi:predicted deacetylase
MTVGGRFLVVSFHGLAPHTQQPCQELLIQLADLGVPRASLLVVPCRQGLGRIEECPSFVRWLASLAEAGHEVCFQGGPADPRITTRVVSFSVANAWHRITSPLMGRLRFKAARKAPVLRIDIHPDDLYERGVRRTLVALLREALRDRTPITCGELAALASQP